MLFATSCLVGPLVISTSANARDLAEIELSRRATAIVEAQELLRKGDQAYQDGRYDEAVEVFAGARDMIPDAPASAELRAAATERYAQAAAEQARVLSRKGDIATAKTALDKVLDKSVAPDNPGALKLRTQLDDPIRSNPALTAGHAQDVDQVRRLLYTAEGAYSLGKFDEANTHYQNVLRIDPTNSAARRGMERINSAQSGYFNTAYDQTRAEMLGQVGAAWETQITAPELGVGPEDPGGFTGTAGTVTLAAKLDHFIVEKIALDQATLGEAIDFLRTITSQTEGAESNSEPINFTVNLGPPDSELAIKIRDHKFSLQLSQVPLSKVLKYITDITGTHYTTDEFSVIIAPLGSTSDELITRNYRVSPDFLTRLGASAGAGGKNPDPFAQTEHTGLLTSRLSAQEALAQQGISFPDGASASYSATTNILRVTNTAPNQDIIAQIVDTINHTEPVTVSVKVTIIKTQQTNQEELSFDWVMSTFGLTGDLDAGGGTPGNSSGRTSADFSSAYPLSSNPDTIVNPGVITNGLRSGNQAISPSTIDSIINNPNRDSQSGTTVAPGIMSLTGIFNEGQAQLMMRGLDNKKDLDIMARPSVVTRSGQAANILIAREFIYPTEYEPPELPNSVSSNTSGSFPVTPATPTAFEKKDVGIMLEVLPVADANKRYIDITINPSITDFDGFVNYGSPITSAADGLLGPQQITITQNTILMPVFSIQRSSTQLTVADGSTIVFAGMMSDSIQSVHDKVPVLGDIPLVGRLFQSKARQPISTAIIFMVQVELMDPTGRPYRDR